MGLDEVKEILLAILGSSAVLGGIGWLFKSRREDKRLEIERWEKRVAELEKSRNELQDKVESLLMDTIAREKENNVQMAQRMELDAKMKEIISAAASALKDCAVVLAKVEAKL
jgi:fructose-1,6-bisphosphatase